MIAKNLLELKWLVFIQIIGGKDFYSFYLLENFSKEILYRLGNGSLMSAAMNKVMIIETLATSKIGGHVALNVRRRLVLFIYKNYYLVWLGSVACLSIH